MCDRRERRARVRERDRSCAVSNAHGAGLKGPRRLSTEFGTNSTLLSHRATPSKVVCTLFSARAKRIVARMSPTDLHGSFL